MTCGEWHGSGKCSGSRRTHVPRRSLRAGKRDEHDHYYPDEKMTLVCPHGEIALSLQA
jgi:hypothetical protein